MPTCPCQCAKCCVSSIYTAPIPGISNNTLPSFPLPENMFNPDYYIVIIPTLFIFMSIETLYWALFGSLCILDSYLIWIINSSKVNLLQDLSSLLQQENRISSLGLSFLMLQGMYKFDGRSLSHQKGGFCPLVLVLILYIHIESEACI